MSAGDNDALRTGAASIGDQGAENADLINILFYTLSSLEFWFKKSNPDWDGSAPIGSTIGDARDAIAKAREAA